MPVYFYLIFAILFITIIFLGSLATRTKKSSQPTLSITQRIDVQAFIEQEYKEILMAHGIDDVDQILEVSFYDLLYEEPMNMLSKQLYPELKPISNDDLKGTKAKDISKLLDLGIQELALFKLERFYFSRYAFFAPVKFGQYADDIVYVKCPYDAFRSGSVRYTENSIAGTILIEFQDIGKFLATEPLPSRAFKHGYPLSNEICKKAFTILNDFIGLHTDHLKSIFEEIRLKIHSEYKSQLEGQIKSLNELWQDANGDLKIAPNAYAQLFNDNKLVINTDHTDKISDLIKIKSFIQENEIIIHDTLKLLLDSKGLNKIIEINKSLIKSADFHEYLVAVGIEFLLALLENDQIRYHEIREMFDRTNVFENSWQKEMKKQMSKVNMNLTEVSNQIGGLRDDMGRFEDNLMSEIGTLQLISARGFSALGSKLNQLNSSVETVGNKIDVGNTIAAINAYENHKSRKALSS